MSKLWSMQMFLIYTWSVYVVYRMLMSKLWSMQNVSSLHMECSYCVQDVYELWSIQNVSSLHMECSYCICTGCLWVSYEACKMFLAYTWSVPIVYRMFMSKLWSEQNVSTLHMSVHIEYRMFMIKLWSMQNVSSLHIECSYWVQDAYE
jgi:hypothetical protein